MSAPARGMRLHPIPAWAGRVVDGRVRYTRLGGSPRGLVYEIAAGRKRVRLLVPVDRITGGYAWSSVAVQPPSRDATMLPALTGSQDFRAMVHRHAWFLNAVVDGALPSDHVPTREERDLAATMAPLAGQDRPLALPEGVDRQDPYMAALDLYFAVVAGDWPRVFGPRPADAPGWLAATLALVNGEVVGLQELAAREMNELKGKPLANIAGTIFKETGFLDAGVELVGSSLEHLEPHEQADILLGLAQLQGRVGREEAAIDMLRRSILLAGNDATFLRRAAAELVRVRALDDAYVVLEDCCERAPDDPDASLDLVQLLLVAGEWERAEARLDAVAEAAPGRPELGRYRGIIAVERRELDRAVEILEAQLAAHPGDQDARTWLTEALIRRGEVDRARTHHTEARAEHDSAVHILIQGGLTEPESLQGDMELAALLEELGEPVGDREPDEAYAHVLEVLASFRGNRGETLARVDPGHVGPTGVTPVRITHQETRLASRVESARAVKDVVRVPLAEVFATFEEIMERYPETAHPYCYRGEVKLWLGDNAGALADFDAAMDLHTVRWGFVGRAAVHVLEGRYADALAQIDACHRVFEPVPSATTNIYLGEMCRLEGRLDRAVGYLEEALRVKPGRLSAWINLAMVHRAAGRRDDARAIFERVVEWAPRLLWDARRWIAAAGEAEPAWPPRLEDMESLFATSLVMMRGNRSSHCVTYFDHEGTFRQVHDTGEWRRMLSRLRAFLWAENRRQILAAG